MRVLVLNCGSSSLKYKLMETSEERIAARSDRTLAHGAIERIGSDDAKISFQTDGGPRQQRIAPVKEHEAAFQLAFEQLTQKGGPISDPRQIEAVGHRIVHGGEDFPVSVLIDDAVLRKIEALSPLAPLHNPHNLKGIYASRKVLPEARQAGVFDTSFHLTLPTRAFLYGLPYELYQRDRIRKYGFHGTSYRYLCERYAEILKTTPDRLKLIACHLGNGSSICAIDGGKSVDTSMGLTPTDGLLMGTRSGELDPGAVLYLVKKDRDGVKGVEAMLNQHSGISGISGGTSDMRDLLKKREQGDGRASDAVDVFCYRVVHFIGAYSMILNGADAIVFSGGIGENAAAIRGQICAGLDFIGLRLDPDRNREADGKESAVTAESSRIPAWVIPTDEELVIARDTFRLVSGSKIGLSLA